MANLLQALPLSARIDPQVSKNFEVLKFFSILMVVVGHSDLLSFDIWVPVTVGLLIFSYSSGYFTALKYTGNFDKKRYWGDKFKRLGVNLLVIQVFLLVLFLVQGRPGIFTWDTLVNVVGLTGFLNWFHIKNVSPFGAGMWFFTLLLIFYLLFPYLEKLYRNKKTATVFCIAYVVVTYFLHKQLVYGHALWLTSCGFVVGVYFARFKTELPKVAAGGTLIASFILIALCNYCFSYKQFNYFLILVFAIAVIQYITKISLPAIVANGVNFFSDCILEIYLLHGYLFFKLFHSRLLDSIISVITIIVLSKVLHSFSSALSLTIYEKSSFQKRV